jgi:hypothetical protein
MKNLKSAVTLSPAIAPFLLTFLLSAQPPTAPTAFPQRIQTLQQAAIENEERLHTYQWIESTTVTMNGSPKPPKQSLCRYTAEGTVAKIPLGPQQQAPQPSGGPLRRHMMEKKMEEVQEEGAEVRSLVALYLPQRPDIAPDMDHSDNVCPKLCECRIRRARNTLPRDDGACTSAAP